MRDERDTLESFAGISSHCSKRRHAINSVMLYLNLRVMSPPSSRVKSRTSEKSGNHCIMCIQCICVTEARATLSFILQPHVIGFKDTSLFRLDDTSNRTRRSQSERQEKTWAVNTSLGTDSITCTRKREMIYYMTLQVSVEMRRRRLDMIQIHSAINGYHGHKRMQCVCRLV